MSSTVTASRQPSAGALVDAVDLFSPYRLGDLDLKNRFVMAPMTRSRALPGNVPNPLAIAYYTQRATAGLIISEGTQVSTQGVGYIRTPGIHTAAQVAGWRPIVDSVHAAGGRIFAQLWHVGRMSHPEFHGGALPVAPSALTPEGEVFTSQGRVKLGAPRALELHEIPDIIAQFRHGAECAKAAGFDGVELHGANGYLLDQFLRDGSNHRADLYGGSIESRARLPLEVTEAVIDVWGPGRVGYKISPYFGMFSMSDSNPLATFSYLTRKLAALDIGYLHVAEPIKGPLGAPVATPRITPALRDLFSNTLIVNGGYDAAAGNAAVASGAADLVAFGVPYLANADLPARFKSGAALNAPDFATFYSGEEKGYTDYPTLAQG